MTVVGVAVLAMKATAVVPATPVRSSVVIPGEDPGSSNRQRCHSIANTECTGPRLSLSPRKRGAGVTGVGRDPSRTTL